MSEKEKAEKFAMWHAQTDEEISIFASPADHLYSHMLNYANELAQTAHDGVSVEIDDTSNNGIWVKFEKKEAEAEPLTELVALYPGTPSTEEDIKVATVFAVGHELDTQELKIKKQLFTVTAGGEISEEG